MILVFTDVSCPCARLPLGSLWRPGNVISLIVPAFFTVAASVLYVSLWFSNCIPRFTPDATGECQHPMTTRYLTTISLNPTESAPESVGLLNLHFGCSSCRPLKMVFRRHPAGWMYRETQISPASLYSSVISNAPDPHAPLLAPTVQLDVHRTSFPLPPPRTMTTTTTKGGFRMKTGKNVSAFPDLRSY
jgi:hypothetical protein